MAETLSQRTAKKLAEENGWTETQGGKHNVKMEKAGCRPVTFLTMAGGNGERTCQPGCEGSS